MSKKAKPPLPANYKGATPRQVAEAVLRYRPKPKPKKPAKDQRAVNPNI